MDADTFMTLEPEQLAAVDAICGAPIAIITGGPGTGKTTCLCAAVDRLEATGARFALCAPTGKAARRMEQAVNPTINADGVRTILRPASTIHRLLGYRGPVEGFIHNQHQPLDVDVVIVDEASMLDVPLAAALCRALGRARLILVGDADQLPPVGPGQLFADLVASGTVPVIRLVRLHRSALQSWIATSAPIVLRGERPAMDTRPDFEFVNVRSSAGVMPALRRVVEVRGQPEPQVLAPMREGPCGTTEANIMLQALINPGPPEGIERDRHHIRVGDRVIHTRNNYELEVYNGDVGQVADITAQAVAVEYPDRAGAVIYNRGRGDDRALELAYALTVHKSQGSEFPVVVCVVHSSHTIMLNRKLFYTAITRAKRAVVLVGDDQGIERALGTGFTKTRLSTLIERITGDIDPVTEAHHG